MSLLNALVEEDLGISELETPLKEVWLAIRTDGDGIGDRSQGNPYAVNSPDSFARIMNTKSASKTVLELEDAVQDVLLPL